MTASQSGVFSLQEFADTGILLVGGRLYTYVAGTTTFKTAYTDAAGTTAQTYTSDGQGGSYIALNARGEIPAPLYLTTGSYDITLKRADGSTVWTRQAEPVADAASGIIASFTAFVASLLASAGSTLIGFIQAGVGAIARTVQAELRETYNAAQFGVTFDNTTDDTTAWNLLILRVSLAGGGTILGRNGATSFVGGATGLLIPSNVTLDLRGGTLRGTGNSSTANTLINSGKVVAGALAINTLSDAVVGMSVRNGTLSQAGLGMSLRYCIDGCSFADLQIGQCYSGLLASFCLYARFDHIMARNTSAGVAFRFTNNCNAITIRNCYAAGTNPGVWGTGFQFDAKTYGVTMLNCSQEYCSTGILTEEVHGLKIIGNYAESVALWLNLQGSGFRKIGVHVSASYFSTVAVLVQGKTVNNFRWDASNERAANCSPGTIDLQADTTIGSGASGACTGTIELGSSDLMTTTPNRAAAVAPSWLLLCDGIELKACAVATRDGGFVTPSYAKASLRSGGSGGVVPFEYGGYTDALSGQVPFCTVTLPTGNPVTASVSTQIAVTNSAFTIFSFTIVDTAGTWTWQGRAYGTTVFLDASTAGGRVMTFTNAGGFLVVTFTLIQNAGGTATLTGQVRFV